MFFLGELLESADLLLYANSVPAFVFSLLSSADSLILLFVAFFLFLSLSATTGDKRKFPRTIALGNLAQLPHIDGAHVEGDGGG